MVQQLAVLPTRRPRKKERGAGDSDLIPVYSGHFRITRELALGSETEMKPFAGPNADITVKGFFSYRYGKNLLPSAAYPLGVEISDGKL